MRLLRPRCYDTTLQNNLVPAKWLCGVTIQHEKLEQWMSYECIYLSTICIWEMWRRWHSWIKLRKCQLDQLKIDFNVEFWAEKTTLWTLRVSWAVELPIGFISLCYCKETRHNTRFQRCFIHCSHFVVIVCSAKTRSI